MAREGHTTAFQPTMAKLHLDQTPAFSMSQKLESLNDRVDPSWGSFINTLENDFYEQFSPEKLCKACGEAGCGRFPQRCPNPELVKVTLHGKRNFSDVIKLRIL